MQTVFRENFTNTDMQLQQRRREFPRFRAKTYRVLSTASRSVRSKRNSFAGKNSEFSRIRALGDEFNAVSVQKN